MNISFALIFIAILVISEWRHYQDRKEWKADRQVEREVIIEQVIAEQSKKSDEAKVSPVGYHAKIRANEKQIKEQHKQ